MLHIVSQSPYHFDVDALWRSINTGDAVLLVQDGVTMSVKGNPILQRFLAIQVDFFALAEDLEARGLLPLISDKIKIVDYYQYVDLTVEYNPQILW